MKIRLMQSASQRGTRPPAAGVDERTACQVGAFPRRVAGGGLARCIVLCSLLFAQAMLQVSVAAPYAIEINKSKRLLVVRDGERVKKTFHISLGRGGRGAKQYFGDNKTPVGTYSIVGFNERSRFDMFLRLNYPNVKDAFYGLQNDVISRTDFERIVRALRHHRVPPQNTPLGGSIGIHGIGDETPERLQIHDNLDWTEGCIALRNADLHELRSFVDIGTRVVIRE